MCLHSNRLSKSPLSEQKVTRVLDRSNPWRVALIERGSILKHIFCLVLILSDILIALAVGGNFSEESQ
jgi:hypothetical protein